MTPSVVAMGGPTPADYAALRTGTRALQDLAAYTQSELAVRVPDARSMRELLDAETTARRVQVRVLGAFAALAVLLAAVGLHGVLAFTVSSQTREMGVRLALGAQRRDVLAMVATQGALWAALGTVPGVVLAYGAGRFLQSLLAGVSPADPLTFAAAVSLSMGATALGCLLPAVRAVRVDPMTALRAEQTACGGMSRTPQPQPRVTIQLAHRQHS